jgi:protein tyrosine phosphatase (PTP) superfamily phosphohydrolase (DUF442 family)
MQSKVVFGLVMAASLIAFAGCCSIPERQSSYPPPPAPCNKCGPGAPVPSRFTPVPADTSPPPAYVPPSNYVPPSGYVPPSNYYPPPTSGVAVPPSARLDPPEAVTQAPPRPLPQRETAKLDPPQSAEPPPLSVPSDSRPVTKTEPETSPRISVDIPQYVVVRTRVAAGQQPFPDGVTWLQNAGYRTVLHVRAPGESDTAAQRIFEKRGLRYLSLEVGPRDLTPQVVAQFSKVVSDEANQPLFVFDRDGSLAGALWYLHFRTVDRMADDKARAEAERLGFRVDQDDNARTMWVAVQTYLRNQNP